LFLVGGGGGGGGGGEKSPKGETDPNLWRKPLFFSKTSRQISPRFYVFGGACRQRPNLLANTCNGPVQNCRQLSRNLPWEVRRFCYTTN